MLEALRRNSRSVIIYVLFGILIAAFILTFGPGSGSGSPGCGGGSAGASYAARVAGATVTEQDFQSAYLMSGVSRYSTQYAKALRIREAMMDAIIDRELLAQEAERRGLRVSEKEAEDMVASGKQMILGSEVPLPPYAFNEDKTFNYDKFKTYCENSLRVTVKRFLETQQRELLADRARRLLRAGAKVTPDEVRADWEGRERQVNLEYVRFSPRRYADSLTLTPAEIAEWRKAHEADVKKYYEEHDYQYKKLDKEARLRHVLVMLPKEADDKAEGAARAKADQAARRLQAGEAFDVVAKALSDDERSKNRGGDMGWRKKGASGLGKDLEDKIFAAQKGALIGPEKTERGIEVVRVEEFREGDIPLEKVADDIAEEQLRMERAKAMARKDAEEAVAKMKELKADESLEKVFPKPSDADESDPLKKLNAPPSAQETGLFPRRGDAVPDVGISAELGRKAFELKQGEVAGPFQASESFVAVRLKERKEPDEKVFAERQEEIRRQLERQKGEQILRAWTKQRCVEARDDKRITVNDDILSYEGPGAAKEDEPKYQACVGPEARMSPQMLRGLGMGM